MLSLIVLSSRLPHLSSLISLCPLHTPFQTVYRRDRTAAAFTSGTIRTIKEQVQVQLTLPKEHWEKRSSGIITLAPVADGGVMKYGRHVKAVVGYEPVLVLDDIFRGAIELPVIE